MNLNQVIHGNSLYEVHSTKTYGAGDDVVVSAEIGISDQPKTNLHDLFHLVKTDGHWKIIPLDLAQMKTMPPSIVAAILSSDMTQQTRLAEKTTCLSNVKQLALGNLIYSNDYDDVMPRSDYWKSAITPYVQNGALFHCPDDKRPKAISYRMSDLLSRVSATAVANPSGTIMIYEGDSGELNPRHDGKGSVGYADGHAKQIDQSQFTKDYHKP
jgi:prepilin-type processing-associated H-X9-DG protein